MQTKGFRQPIVKTLNVVAYVLLVASSLYSILEPDIWSFTKDTHVLPARWGFYVWHPLNVLLFGPILCQFVPGGSPLIVGDISWRLPLLNASTAILVQLWIHDLYVPSFLFVILSRLAVYKICSILKEYDSDATLMETLFVRVPMSFYTSWMDVLCVVVGFQAFTVSSLNYSVRCWVKGDAGPWTKLFVFASLIYLLSRTITSAFNLSPLVSPSNPRHSRTLSINASLSFLSSFLSLDSPTSLALSHLAHTIPITWALWAIFWLHLHPFWYSLPGSANPPGSPPPPSTADPDSYSYYNVDVLKYGTLAFAIASSVCVVVAALRVIVWVVKAWRRSGGIIRFSVEVEDWSWGGDGRDEMETGRGRGQGERRVGRWEVGVVRYGSYGYGNGAGGAGVRLAGEEGEVLMRAAGVERQMEGRGSLSVL